MLVYGINPVMEALRSGRVLSITASARAGARIHEIVKLADQAGTPLRLVEPEELDRRTRGAVHQGVLAEVEPVRAYSVADLIRGAAAVPLLVVLDGIEDPQNMGAILRTAEAAGVDGLIRQTRRSAPLTPAVAKASAGAISHVKIAPIVNVARGIEELKKAGVWTVGLSGDADRVYTDIDFTLPTALVLGAEGTGLRRLVRERCDWLAAIPMAGRLGSLNVSVAAGVALFEAARQRRAGERLAKFR